MSDTVSDLRDTERAHTVRACVSHLSEWVVGGRGVVWCVCVCWRWWWRRVCREGEKGRGGGGR